MAYLGTPPQSGFITTAKQRVTSSTNNYVDLDHAISSLADVIVWVNFVKQDSTNLSLTTSTRITLGGTLVSSDIVEIAYLGKAVNTQTPGTGTVTNDMLAGSIANSKLANSSITLNGSAVSLGGSATISSALVYVGGLNTTTEAASVAVDNVFTATYDNYLVVIESIRMKTTGGGLDFNWRTGGSSGSKVSGGNYRYALFGYRSDNGNSTSRYASSGGETRLTHGCVNDGETVGLSGYLHVSDPFTSQRVRFTGNYTYMADAAGELRSMSGGSEYRDNIQATGFMFTGFGGTADDDIVEAQIKVYGLVNS